MQQRNRGHGPDRKSVNKRRGNTGTDRARPAFCCTGMSEFYRKRDEQQAIAKMMLKGIADGECYPESMMLMLSR